MTRNTKSHPMKYLFNFSILFFIGTMCACYKKEQQSPKIPNHTDGIAGARNWHVYTKSFVQHPVSTDSITYEGVDTQLADMAFAVAASGSDTLVVGNERYGYTHTDGSYLYFPIWHHKYSGNQSVVRYNVDSNTVMIYSWSRSIYSHSETWYYSFR